MWSRISLAAENSLRREGGDRAQRKDDEPSRHGVVDAKEHTEAANSFAAHIAAFDGDHARNYRRRHESDAPGGLGMPQQG